MRGLLLRYFYHRYRFVMKCIFSRYSLLTARAASAAARTPARAWPTRAPRPSWSPCDTTRRTTCSHTPPGAWHSHHHTVFLPYYNLVLFYPTSTTHVIILLLGFNCSQKFEAVIVVLVNYYAVRN